MHFFTHYEYEQTAWISFVTHIQDDVILIVLYLYLTCVAVVVWGVCFASIACVYSREVTQYAGRRCILARV